MAPRSNTLLPIGAVVLGIAVFSLMDTVMKAASIVSGVYTALLMRNLIGTAMLAPVWLARRKRWPATAVLAIHALRAVLVAIMGLLFFYGLVRLPMAEGIALSFIAPLIALYLAAWLLGEQVRKGALPAFLLGLAGVLVIAIARMEGSSRAPASPDGIIAILGSALLYAINLVIQRRQAQLAGPLEITFFQHLVAATFFLPAAPWLFSAPSGFAVLEMALAAASGAIALGLFAWGYARAEAQVLLPIEYTAFFWSAAFGWLFFHEPLGLATIVGAALIIAGCLLAARLSPEPKAGTPTVPAP
jgi:S-adenosylmethionine uptake transporter